MGEERVGKGQLYHAENGRFINVSGDSSPVNHMELHHDNSADISERANSFPRPTLSVTTSRLTDIA